LTPLNRLGVMMFPTQRASEDSVKASRHFVMAIKPFAGGRLHPKVALQYVYNKLHIASCMIGVGLIRGVRTRCLSGFTNPLERYMRSIPACWYEPSFLSMMIVKLTRKIWWLCLPSRRYMSTIDRGSLQLGSQLPRGSFHGGVAIERIRPDRDS